MESKELEIWKTIDEFPYIEVSSLGRIKKLPHSWTKKETIQSDFFKDKDGYCRINIQDKNGNIRQHAVHRLVALAFIPNPENKQCVNHINSNRQDNRVSNLEWVTPRENVYHSYAFGKAVKRKEVPHNKVLTEFQISEIDNLRNIYTVNQIAKLFNVNYSTLKNIIRKKKQHEVLDNQQPSNYTYLNSVIEGSTTIPNGSRV